jgi:hypothetical protein
MGVAGHPRGGQGATPLLFFFSSFFSFFLKDFIILLFLINFKDFHFSFFLYSATCQPQRLTYGRLIYIYIYILPRVNLSG